MSPVGGTYRCRMGNQESGGPSQTEMHNLVHGHQLLSQHSAAPQWSWNRTSRPRAALLTGPGRPSEADLVPTSVGPITLKACKLPFMPTCHVLLKKCGDVIKKTRD